MYTSFSKAVFVELHSATHEINVLSHRRYFIKNGKKQKILKCVSHSKSIASLNIFQVYTLDLCVQSEKNKICSPSLEGVYLEVKTPKSRLRISATLIQ